MANEKEFFLISMINFLQVIPPGMDFSNVVVQEDISEADGDIATVLTNEASSPRAVPTIWSEVSIISVYAILSYENKALCICHKQFLTRFP